MSLEQEVAELRGRLMSLEKLVTDSLLEQILDCKVKAIASESAATRAVEIVQALVNQEGGGEVSAEVSGTERFDVRGGGIVRQGEEKE